MFPEAYDCVFDVLYSKIINIVQHLMYSRNYTKNFTHIILLILYNKNIIDKCLTGVN